MLDRLHVERREDRARRADDVRPEARAEEQREDADLPRITTDENKSKSKTKSTKKEQEEGQRAAGWSVSPCALKNVYIYTADVCWIDPP